MARAGARICYRRRLLQMRFSTVPSSHSFARSASSDRNSMKSKKLSSAILWFSITMFRSGDVSATKKLPSQLIEWATQSKAIRTQLTFSVTGRAISTTSVTRNSPSCRPSKGLREKPQSPRSSQLQLPLALRPCQESQRNSRSQSDQSRSDLANWDDRQLPPSHEDIQSSAVSPTGPSYPVSRSPLRTDLRTQAYI